MNEKLPRVRKTEPFAWIIIGITKNSSPVEMGLGVRKLRFVKNP